jgi:hypothetical protein
MLVPGHTHDLFPSQALAESQWVDAFKEAFCQEFHELANSKQRVAGPLTLRLLKWGAVPPCTKSKSQWSTCNSSNFSMHFCLYVSGSYLFWLAA